MFNIFSGAGVNFEFPKSLYELGADMIQGGTLSNVTLNIQDGLLDIKQEYLGVGNLKIKSAFCFLFNYSWARYILLSFTIFQRTKS